MKTAIYLDEGNTQLVLTPENDWEKNILRMIHADLPSTFWGEFYGCQGGWIRQPPYAEGASDPSLIFRLQKKADIPQ